MNPVPSDLAPAQYIRRTSDLRRLIDRLRNEPLVAIDTESNSLFAYYERVCLVQLSTRDQDYLIDPLAVDDMSPLAALLADPGIETVFHAAEYDIITLKRDFGFDFANLFDTMFAGRICGWSRLGLGNMLEDQFGVHVDKKYQRADWSQRPLPSEQLLYAQMAVVRELYLLRDEIARERDWPPFKVFGDETLVAVAVLSPRRAQDLSAVRGLNDRFVQHEGERIVQAVARGLKARPPHPPRRPREPDPDVLLRYDALRAWRKQRAAERGVESDVIIPRDTMWALARRVPARAEDLEEIPGLGPWRRAEYGTELIAVLKRTNGNTH